MTSHKLHSAPAALAEGENNREVNRRAWGRIYLPKTPSFNKEEASFKNEKKNKSDKRQRWQVNKAFGEQWEEKTGLTRGITSIHLNCQNLGSIIGEIFVPWHIKWLLC